MKKLCILLVAALLLCLCASAWAEDGMRVEVIKMDGVSVVVLTPEATLQLARNIAMNADEDASGFVLPRFLTVIGQDAFAGIDAASIEVSENVVAIEARAFADCKNLRKITIPVSVKEIDEHAFDGCENLTVYGAMGTAAEWIADQCDFDFIDPEAPPEPEPIIEQKIPSAPVLPAVPLG